MLLDRFLPRIEFDSYEDFKANYKVNVPENFNFGFDIVDAWADSEPEKKALVWCDDHDHERMDAQLRPPEREKAHLSPPPARSYTGRSAAARRS